MAKYIRYHQENWIAPYNSNEQCPTNAVRYFREHPIYLFHKDGIKGLINTDNRTVSDTTMTKECQLVNNEFNLGEEDYRQIYVNSVEASFADKDTKEWCLS